MSKRICFILIIYKHFHLCCFTAFAYTTTDIVYLFPRTQFLYSVFDKIGRGFGSPEELEIDFFSIQGYWLKGRLHNSTQLDVELSTRSQREQLSPISSERRVLVRVPIATSCVGEVSIATRRRNSTRRRVELSCVAINGL